MENQVLHQDAAGGGAFYIERDGVRIAEMTYRRTRPGQVLVDHTEVDPVLRGRGVARQLLDALVTWARGSGTRVTASCSYVVVQFARDKSLRDIQP